MGVTRRIIFPTLRLIIWAVIAVALAKIAFTGTKVTTTSDALEPTGQVVEPTVTVESATITNTVSVAANVVTDPSVQVKATLAGTVLKLVAADGQAVAAGDPVLTIRQETPQDPVVTTDPTTGEQTTTERKPIVKTETVKASVGGTLSLPTLKDQVVSVGDVVASIAPGTLSVTGTLTPDQQYRLISAPTEAQVKLKGGPAPFTCTGLRIGPAATGTTGSSGDDGSATTSSGTITCAIPAGVTAFAGLGADLQVTNGTAEGPAVPVSAVQGTVQTGNVWVVASEGAEPEERAVTLGLTDGQLVQVVDGLAVGDLVLQFTPVASDESVDCTDPANYGTPECGS